MLEKQAISYVLCLDMYIEHGIELLSNQKSLQIASIYKYSILCKIVLVLDLKALPGSQGKALELPRLLKRVQPAAIGSLPAALAPGSHLSASHGGPGGCRRPKAPFNKAKKSTNTARPARSGSSAALASPHGGSLVTAEDSSQPCACAR